jgi:hypothetical protein
MEIRKWQYLRDDMATIDDLDARLKHWGGLEWELVTILHTNEMQRAPDENILAPEGWILLFKQPAP